MPDQDLDGIGARIIANLNNDNRLSVFEPFIRFAD